MLFRLNSSTGLPMYLQLIEQVKHAIETGALKAGDQLPTIRKVAEDLVMNPNTVVRAYRELEHEGVVDLRHGSGAFIKESAGDRTRVVRKPLQGRSHNRLRLAHYPCPVSGGLLDERSGDRTRVVRKAQA